MSRLIIALATVAGILAGGLAVIAFVPVPAVPEPIPIPTPRELPTVSAAPAPEAAEGLLLVWTPAALPEGLAAEVRELPGFEAVAAVAGGSVDLIRVTDADGHRVDELAPGWRIPLDALAIEPPAYAELLPRGTRATISMLEPGQALLGETSAHLRRIGPGASLRLDGGLEITIAGVVDDTLVGAAEVVLHRTDAEAAGISTERFLLVSHRGDRGEAEAAIRRLLPDGVTARIRAPGETPFLRHGDAVLPQSQVKAIFGEFAYQPPSPGERDFVQDPDWIDAQIVSVDAPILGTVRCHRGIIDQLVGALEELEQSGLAHLVDPEQYAGCWAPRLIRPDGDVSRHAWGITVDLNADQNPTGVGSGQDPRLIETLSRWGFTWGGFWLVPDPMHFEYVRPPEPPG